MAMDTDVKDLMTELREDHRNMTVVLNLLDENYVESGGFPAAGRSVLLGAGFDFGS